MAIGGTDYNNSVTVDFDTALPLEDKASLESVRKIESANKIKRCFSNYRSNRQWIEQHLAAKHIQKTFRLYRVIKQKKEAASLTFSSGFSKKLFPALKAMQLSATKIQSCMRGVLERNILRKDFIDKEPIPSIFSPIDFKEMMALKKRGISNDRKAAIAIQTAWRDSVKRSKLVHSLLTKFPEELNGFRKRKLSVVLLHMLHATRDIQVAERIEKILQPIVTNRLYLDAFFVLLDLVKEPLCAVDPTSSYKIESAVGPQIKKRACVSLKLHTNRDFCKTFELIVARVKAVFLSIVPSSIKDPKHLVFFTQGCGRGHQIAADSFAAYLRDKGYKIAIFNSRFDMPDESVEVLGYKKPLLAVGEKLDKEVPSQKRRIKEIDDIYNRLTNYLPFTCVSDFARFLAKHGLNPSAAFVFGPAIKTRALNIATHWKIPIAAFLTDYNGSVSNKYEPLVANPRDPNTFKILAPQAKRVLTDKLLEEYSTTFGTRKKDIPSKALDVGYPVRPSFIRISKAEKVELKKRLGVKTSAKVVLITGGGLGYFSQLEILKKIVLAPKGTFETAVHLVMITGENTAVYRETLRYIETLPKGLPFTFTVIKNADEKQMAECMQISDVMIGKTGGSTTAECYATGTRVMPISIGGLTWEKKNAEFLRKQGLLVEQDKDIVSDLGMALKDEFIPKLLRVPETKLEEVVEALLDNYKIFERDNLPKQINHVFRILLQQDCYDEAKKLIDSPYANLKELEVIVHKVYNMRKLPEYRFSPPISKEERNELVALINVRRNKSYK